MHFGPFDTADKVVIVAEIGNNHEGNVATAERMVVEAARTGVDAVKFQTFIPERLNGPDDTARIERLRKFQLGTGALRRLADIAKANRVLFFSTPFDLESVRVLDAIAPVFKIASSDSNFYPLLAAVADTGKPIALSAGLSTLEEMTKARDIIQGRWAKAGVSPALALLHCVSAYPAPLEEANLRAIQTLATLGCVVGYSDHVLGIEASVLAVALGARIIEKHFTLDKNFSDYRDHQLSADPAEMTKLVGAIRRAERMLGNGIKDLQPSEQGNLKALRRSIVGARDLPAGTLLTMSDITWVRPGGGLAPGDEGQILGRRLRANVAAGKPLTNDLFE